MTGFWFVLFCFGSLILGFWLGWTMANSSRRHKHEWSAWSEVDERWGVYKVRRCSYPKCGDIESVRLRS